MWGSESPSPGETQVEPMSPCPGVAQVKTRVNRSGWVTVSEQCNHILMLPKWVRETPSLGEAQVRQET